MNPVPRSSARSTTLLGVLLAGLLPAVTSATTITWSGVAADNLWASTTNWTGDTLPGSADVATFDSAGNFNITLGVSPTLDGLALSANATGTVKLTLGSSTKITLDGGASNDISVAAGNLEIVGLNQGAGDLTLQGTTSSTASQVWDVATGSTLTFTNVHMRTGNAAQNFNKTGEGTVVLNGDSFGTGSSGQNPWAFGRFTVSGGTVKIANAKAIGKATNSVTVADGATLELAANYNAIDGTLTLNGAGFGNVGALYNSTGTNSIADGTGSVTLAANAAIGVAASTQLTIAQDITESAGGAKALTKVGAGTLILSGTNTYTGNTIVNLGTLRVSNNSALGSGGTATLNAGTLLVDNAVTLANNLVLSGGQVQRTTASGATYTLGTSGTVSSAFAGGTEDTSARLLAAQTAGSATTVTYAFSGTSLAINDASRLSDVFSLGGSGGDIYVLQLSLAAIGEGSSLGWLNGDGQWVNAVAGNSTTGGSAITSFAGSFASSGAGATAAWLGSWGYDTASGTVWAVLDHGGDFAITAIPEPRTTGLIFGGLTIAALCWLKRRRATA